MLPRPRYRVGMLHWMQKNCRSLASAGASTLSPFSMRSNLCVSLNVIRLSSFKKLSWKSLGAPRDDHSRFRSARVPDSLSCRILICSIDSSLSALCSTDLAAISSPIVSLFMMQASFQARPPIGITESYSYHERTGPPLSRASFVQEGFPVSLGQCARRGVAKELVAPTANGFLLRPSYGTGADLSVHRLSFRKAAPFNQFLLGVTQFRIGWVR